MSKSKIQWTDNTWNPITGCTPISPGCKNCYAKRMANRLKGRYGYPADEPFRVTFHPDRLDQPAKWKKPCRIFVCSMGDLFHEDVSRLPETSGPCATYEIFSAMINAPQHTYMILTKRPSRMGKYVKARDYFDNFRKLIPNLYLGVTVESNDHLGRIDELLKLRAYAKVLFVSAEPLLGELDLEQYLPSGTYCFNCERHFKQTAYKENEEVCPGCMDNQVPGGGTALIDSHEWLYGQNDDRPPAIDWVIAGGESGPGARPSHPDWFRKIRGDCQAPGVPFFFKQWGEWLPYSQALSDEQLEAVSKTTIAGKQTYFGASVDWNRMKTTIAPHMQAIQTNMIGKKKAGNLLDGVKHEGRPE